MPLPPEAEEACDAFCDLYDRLDCGPGSSPGADEIDGTADDVPCGQVCRDEVEAGAYAPDRACLNEASSCSAAEACIFGPDQG